MKLKGSIMLPHPMLKAEGLIWYYLIRAKLPSLKKNGISFLLFN